MSVRGPKLTLILSRGGPLPGEERRQGGLALSSEPDPIADHLRDARSCPAGCPAPQLSAANIWISSDGDGLPETIFLAFIVGLGRQTVETMSRTPDVVIAGGGIAGSALAAVLARGNVQVAVLERDREPVDRVRGEGMAPWGVIELRRLGLYDALVGAGGAFTNLAVPHDEHLPGEKALPFTLRITDLVPEVPGILRMSHPAMCRVLAAEAEATGAVFLRGVTDIAVTAGAPPQISFSHGGQRIAWTPRLGHSMTGCPSCCTRTNMTNGCEGRSKIFSRSSSVAFPTTLSK
jgi:FAD binding domain